MTEKAKLLLAIGVYVVLSLGIFFVLDISESMQLILFIILLATLSFTKRLIKKKAEVSH